MYFDAKFGPVALQYVIVVVANFNLISLSMGVAWSSPVLVKLRDGNQTVLQSPITLDEGAWVVSLGSITGLFTIVIMGYLIDKFGRKRMLLLAFLPRLAMCIFALITTDIWMLYISKAFCGIADVMTLSTIPTYASEIASKEIRGGLGTITQIISSIGMLIMLSVGPFVSYITLNVIYICCTVGFFLPQVFLPESPYFLYVKGDQSECLKLLTRLRGSEERALDEIKEYSATMDKKINKLDIIKHKTVLKTVGKVIFLGIFFQLVGYNALSVYLQSILESTNTTVMPEISSAIIGCIQLVACLCAIFLSDKFGRKPLLVTTLFGMAVGLVGLGAFFKITEMKIEIMGFLNYLPLISFMLAIFCFNAGLGSLQWMLVAELFDGPTRAFGVSVSIFCTTVFIFLTTNYFTTVIELIGASYTYWMFATSCIIDGLFILFFIPETKGRSFTEIQESLRRVVRKTSPL